MASTPSATLQHVWTALMRTLGIRHPSILRGNEAAIAYLRQRTGGR